MNEGNNSVEQRSNLVRRGKMYRSIEVEHIQIEIINYKLCLFKNIWAFYSCESLSNKKKNEFKLTLPSSLSLQSFTFFFYIK